jgi:hypothetical protein
MGGVLGGVFIGLMLIGAAAGFVYWNTTKAMKIEDIQGKWKSDLLNVTITPGPKFTLIIQKTLTETAQIFTQIPVSFSRFTGEISAPEFKKDFRFWLQTPTSMLAKLSGPNGNEAGYMLYKLT